MGDDSQLGIHLALNANMCINSEASITQRTACRAKTLLALECYYVIGTSELRNYL